MIYFVIAIIVLILLYIIIQYNTFIKLTNSVKEAFATMDVYLKKRWDLIPNIVSIVKGYAKHESNTLEEVVKIRSLAYEKMSVTDKIDTNEQLQNYLDRLIINIENYPELKADKNFLNLSKQLEKIEDEIANSRKYYNAVVKKLNIKIQMFPSNIIAKMFKFKIQKMFSIEENEKSNVKVDL